jgi:alpha-L-fucosidase
MIRAAYTCAVLLVSSFLTPGSQPAVPPPLPVMSIPTARQLEWQERELAMFVHFTVNTFTDREWGTGKENPQIFNPASLDVNQWVEVAKEFGFKSIVLTSKHHDGFCLWPSRYTDHTVASSPWKNGQGDVVGELAQACRAAGIKLGLYLSPWDRHEPSYGDELRYNLFYLAQLRELLSGYGELAEVWFDGAKGEDAKDMNYFFLRYWTLVRQLQPGAVIFSDEGPDVRWIGNERGSAGDTNWSMLDRRKVSVGKADTGYLNGGDIDGPDWLPGETDVSIRKGWFWHPDQEPKSLGELLDIYFHSVGRNSVLLLNVPPNRTGLLDDRDVSRLRELRERLDRIFETNLARGAAVTASEARGNSADFAADLVVDGERATYWAAHDGSLASTLELNLPDRREFNVAMLGEPIRLGQRVKAYRLDAWTEAGWKTLSEGTTIGYKKLDRFDRVNTDRVRLSILDARACPLIDEIGLYLDPER